MPLDIETELLNRLLIGTIMHLLEEHQPYHGIQFLGGPAIAVMIMGAQRLHREFGEDMLLKKPSPGIVQEITSLGSQMGPWIEDVELFVIFHVKHCFVSHFIDIAKIY